jgi:hypothetical protein
VAFSYLLPRWMVLGPGILHLDSKFLPAYHFMGSNLKKLA